MIITVRNLQKKIPVNPKRIKKAVLKALSCEGRFEPGEINVYLIQDKRIRTLNRRFLHKDMPTDVLAFDISISVRKGLFADIFISTDAATRNAKEFNTSPQFELCLYAIHGALHLLGYNDHNKKDNLAMRKKEESLIYSLNL